VLPSARQRVTAIADSDVLPTFAACADGRRSGPINSVRLLNDRGNETKTALPLPDVVTDRSSTLRRILFVCTGNTCRSVLAEHLGRRFCGDAFTFESAGMTPQVAADADHAVHILRKRFGIDASGHQPRNVRGLDLEKFDLVIAFESTVATLVRGLGVPESKLQVWTVRDPWGGDLTEYDRAALEIRRKLASLK